jgi:hypothetical protein
MTPKEFVFNFVKKNPGCNQSSIFAALAGHGVSEPKAKKAIKNLHDDGAIIYERGRYNRFIYNVAQESYEEAQPETEQEKFKKFKPSEKDFVYGIRIIGERPIKIGITKDLKSRLSTMQTGNYKTYYIAFAVLTESPLELERELHEMFGAQRLRGEWFDIDQQDLINAIAELRV